MAIGHLSVKIGKAGKAAPHAAYIARIGKYADRLNRGEVLEATGYGNMPAWAAHNPLHFWEAADQNERSNGSTYREHEIALPRELSTDQRRALVEDWIKQEIGTSYAYQYAIHNPTAADGKEQPHAHLMFSERKLDGIDRDREQFFKRYNAKNPEKGGAKKDNTGKDRSTRKEELKAQRTRWGEKVNAHLSHAGESASVDMRSYKDRGLDIQPEPKMSPAEWRNPVKRAEVLEQRASNTTLAQALRNLHRLAPDLEKARRELKIKRDARFSEQAIVQKWGLCLNWANAKQQAIIVDAKNKADGLKKKYEDWKVTKHEEPPFEGWSFLDKLQGKPKKWAAWETEKDRRWSEWKSAEHDHVQRTEYPDRYYPAVQAAQEKFRTEYPEYAKRKAELEKQKSENKPAQVQAPITQAVEKKRLEREQKMKEMAENRAVLPSSKLPPTRPRGGDGR